MRYSCVYTQRITQRQKKYKEGFIEITKCSNGFYNIIIFDEENQKLVSLRSSEEPILGSDFQVGAFLIQIDSSMPLLSKAEQKICNNTFIPSSRVAPLRPLPQKNSFNNNNSKESSKNNRSTCNIAKNIGYFRKLRAKPRRFEEIIAFYNVECDPSILNKNLVQRNLKEYLDS